MFNEDDDEDFFTNEKDNKDKLHRIYNKDFPDERIVVIGENEIKQNQNLLKIQKNLKINNYNNDYNKSKELIDSKYGLFLNLNDKSSEDGSDEEENWTISNKSNTKDNIDNNKIDSSQTINQEINKLFISYKKILSLHWNFPLVKFSSSTI